ncbi:uncharacterized protein TrAtP1_006056 [Trichoderma atroviride]|uniref:Nascent polypeptide-associated complex subunit alpha-like UBA domain-containing protein n=1 Tax=Hypocrea atroviridis (strain ATCC 20476 / IMI 206040) TaxID=452589 RepID=G9PAI8_HYPAI|nr:uncharacterized protein TRIATDRAFT_259856 [Trichoderma atroviride IMI 206040]EHK40022.1 hypothetical protein TRIATDRAFT_259856 [Trichoderma atroviride IMI 206040]UKZ64847.1 hypothetical protein TrAtP1_006056 [Trichoderma atroviride]
MSSADASDQPPLPKNAEDRKAASALASLDTPSDAAATPSNDNVNSEAVSQAMLKLGDDKAKKPAANTASAAAAAAAPAAVKKNVKVDAADVALVVDELEVTKARATELLKAHDGDAVATLRAAARG